MKHKIQVYMIKQF